MLHSSWLTSVLRRFAPQRTQRPRPRRSARIATSAVCRIEQLEPRVLLSASPVGTESLVNGTTAGAQLTNTTGQGGSIAIDAEGDYVVTWTSNGHDGSGYGVYARRYNAAGAAQGGEFRVNTTTAGNQQNATVAMDATGDFVITWSSYGDGGGYGIYAQRYNAAGVKQGSEFKVNTTTANDQRFSTVAMDAGGDFVVTWMSYDQDGSGYGVYAQRYDSAGVQQGNEFLVNSTTADSQSYSTVAMDASGNFVVTWSSPDSSGSGVFAQRFDATGVAQGGEFQVNTTGAGSQLLSTVAMDRDGEFVITWSSDSLDVDLGWDIYAQRYSAAGAALGSEILVNTTTMQQQTFSTVAMDADGDFVVTWMSDSLGGGVLAQQFSASGAALGGEFLVNTNQAASQSFPTVAMDAAGDYVIAWSSIGIGPDLSSHGVFAQRYDESTSTAGPIVARVLDGGHPITAGDQLVSSVSSLTVVFSSDMNLAGGSGGLNSVTNPANWNLTRNGVDVTGTVSGIAFAFNPTTLRHEAVISFSTPLDDGEFQLTAKQSIQALNGNALDGDLNGTPGGDFILDFSIARLLPAGGEFQVNTTTLNNQITNTQGQGGAVAIAVTGDFVVTWTSDEGAPDSYGNVDTDVYAQRYNAAGVAQGSEFRVNTTVVGDQYQSTVAIDAAGNFVVTWTSDDNISGTGVYAQRYNAAGVAQVAEFRVNPSSIYPQVYSTVAMDASGDFVIAWQGFSMENTSHEIFVQRYNASGVAQGGAFRANTTTASEQMFPAVAMDASGDFTVVWWDVGSGLPNIRGQRFNTSGVPQGSEFQVNSLTVNTAMYSAIAMDGAGDFVVTWMESDEVGNYVTAQRYNASGVAQGVQFHVTESQAASMPTVAMDEFGGFVVTWTSNDASESGVYAKRYSAEGLALGDEFLINTTTVGSQGLSAVAMNASGDFVVAWTSSGQDGSENGVFAQRYQSNISPVLAVSTSISYTENDPATPINTGLTVSDFDSSTLASATVTITNFVAGQDVLAFVNDGLTMGNIAVSTNVGGVLTLTSPGATATTGEWQAALRAVTYANSSGNPDATQRSVDFVINDGMANGNILNSTIGITATNDAPVLAVSGSITYTVNSAATVIDTGLTVLDVDSATLASATVTITNFVAGQDDLAFVNDGSTMGNIAVSTNVGGVLTLTSPGGTATTTQWQAALRAVTYANSSGSPDTTQRTVGFVVNDGAVDSNTLTSTISINTAPVLAVSGSISYTENDPATVIDVGLTVSDATNATLVSATVTITNFVAGQDVVAFVNDGSTMGDIAVSTNVGGVLTLTSPGGTATTTQWQAALRAVTYTNSSENPDTSQRSVDFVVNDGAADSNTVTSTIDITATNDAPVLSNIESGVLPYPPASTATVISSTLTVADMDHSSLAGATVQITGHYQSGSDVLAFVNTPNITGVFNATTGMLTLTGSDSVANYQAALRSVTYQTTSQDLTARTISLQVDDGTSLSNIQTRSIGGELQLVGTTLNVYGTTGVDVITITDGASLTIHRNGLDYVYTSASVTAINIFGNDNDDSIQVMSLANGTALQVFGGNGNDTILVDSSVTGGVTLDGGADNDLLVGGSGADNLAGGSGNDSLDGGDGEDTLAGGTGNDVYVFRNSTSNQMDTVVEQAGEGTDRLDFEAISTAVNANLNSDTGLATMLRRIVRTGGSGQAANFEFIHGGSANDFITGNSADNVIKGNGGNDTLNGGDGNDSLDGGQGSDLLKGGNQDDVLIGGIGDDYLKGEAGNDVLQGGDGFNTLAGGTGNDTFTFGNATVNQLDTVIELVGEGIDTLNFAALTTAVNANLTSDANLATMSHRIVAVGGTGQSAHFENVTGGSGNDQVTGNAADNILRGNGGNDTMSGGSGNDVLLGGDGNDTLKGISGRNILAGGAGADLVLGGTDEDILLAGVLKDESDSLLQTLRTEWTQPTPYVTRVNNLQPYANSTYIADDSGADYLAGAAGLDWFLANSVQDILTDKTVDELFTHIDGWI